MSHKMSAPHSKYTFSAILSNFNHSQYLPDALDRILGQTRPFDEILIIDDASTDDSVSVIQRLIDGVSNARLIQLENNIGVNEVVNLGARLASGDYLYCFSADDLYDTHLLEWCENVLREHGPLAMVSGNASIFHATEGWKRSFELPHSGNTPTVWDKSDILRHSKKMSLTFYGGSNLMKRSAFLEAGGFRNSLRWHSDWFLYFTLALRYRVGIVPKTFVTVRVSGHQYSHARHEWRKESEVFNAFMKLLEGEFSDLFDFFRAGALLPMYPISSLHFFLLQGKHRKFVTPLLLWRLLTFGAFRAIGKSIPPQLKNAIRSMVRV